LNEDLSKIQSEKISSHSNNREFTSPDREFVLQMEATRNRLFRTPVTEENLISPISNPSDDFRNIARGLGFPNRNNDYNTPIRTPISSRNRQQTPFHKMSGSPLPRRVEDMMPRDLLNELNTEPNPAFITPNQSMLYTSPKSGNLRQKKRSNSLPNMQARNLNIEMTTAPDNLNESNIAIAGVDKFGDAITNRTPKRRGRPVGSRNKPK
jgi:hypothetical protein